MSSELFRGRRVLWMPLEVPWQRPSPAAAFCCNAMRAALAFDCGQHADPFECADSVMIYNEVFDEVGIPVHDGGASYVLVRHCPWCGTKQPDSQRDRWFDEIDRKGLEEAGLPDAYRTGAWRRGA